MKFADCLVNLNLHSQGIKKKLILFSLLVLVPLVTLSLLYLSVSTRAAIGFCGPYSTFSRNQEGTYLVLVTRSCSAGYFIFVISLS